MARLARRLAACGILLATAVTGVLADTLVLRDGRTLRGRLVRVRDGVIDFEEDRGWRGPRLVQIDRADVRRIEFDETGRDAVPLDRAARPSGLREREVIVSADVAWNDTGVDVRAGQRLYFTASGRVRWGPDRRDGPGGERGSPYNPNRPLPQRPAAALIAKIGADSTDYFFIGEEPGPIQMRGAGRLYLGVNDDYLADNSGNFRVIVFY